MSCGSQWQENLEKISPRICYFPDDIVQTMAKQITEVSNHTKPNTECTKEQKRNKQLVVDSSTVWPNISNPHSRDLQMWDKIAYNLLNVPNISSSGE